MPYSSKVRDDNVMYIYMCQFSPLYRDPIARRMWARMLAESMCVTPKTIRDIWNRKSWTHVTRRCGYGTGYEIDQTLFYWELFATERSLTSDPFAHDV